MLLPLLSTFAFAAPSPDDVERWLPRFDKALRRGDDATLRSVFAEPLARTPPEQHASQLEAVRSHLRGGAMKGEREISCRAELCRVRWVREDESSYLILHRVDGAWRIWDESWGDHVAGQVTARIEARGPGRVEVRVNGAPTYLFDAVQDETAMVSMLDRALVPGRNSLTLVPTGEVEVSVRVGGWSDESVVDTTRGDLVEFDGPLTTERTFRFDVEPGPRPLPR